MLSRLAVDREDQFERIRFQLLLGEALIERATGKRAYFVGKPNPLRIRSALRQIGAQDFSIAVVAVGSSIEASVLITANLVDLKIPQIWAKAISKSHGKILSRIGANHVIYPEAEAGEESPELKVVNK